jgi:hypothetical protein
MHDVLGNNDFYKDVHEAVRIAPSAPAGVNENGYCQMEFVKICCDVAKLDLTEFFEAWGFLRAVNFSQNDYGTEAVIVTQKMVDDAKAWIAAKKYPKPRHDFTRITDVNWQEYK